VNRNFQITKRKIDTMEVICETDRDCPTPQVCFSTGECGCNIFYGMTGAGCTGYALQGFAVIMLASVTLWLSSLALGMNIKVILRLRRYNMREWNTTSATLAFTTVSLIGLVGWKCITLGILFLPNGHTLFLSTSDKRLHRLIPGEKIFQGLAVLFALLAAINIVVKWLDIAERSQKLLKVEGIWGVGYTKRIYAFMGLFLAAVIMASVIGDSEVASASGLPFLIVLQLAYLYGMHKMSKILSLLADSIQFQEQQVVAPESLPSSNVYSTSSMEPQASSEMSTRNGNHDKASAGRRSIFNAFSKISVRVSVRARAPTQPKSDKARDFYVLLSRIKVTAALAVSAFFALTIVNFYYAYVQLKFGFAEACGPRDSICVVGIVYELIGLGILAVVAVVEKYIHDNVKFVIMRRGVGKSSQSIPASPDGAQDPEEL